VDRKSVQDLLTGNKLLGTAHAASPRRGLPSRLNSLQRFGGQNESAAP
jgi:hypothetical protein